MSFPDEAVLFYVRFTLVRFPLQTVSKQYKVDGIPTYYLIDPNGKIVSSWFGYRRKRLDRELDKHLIAKN